MVVGSSASYSHRQSTLIRTPSHLLRHLLTDMWVPFCPGQCEDADYHWLMGGYQFTTSHQLTVSLELGVLLEVPRTREEEISSISK